jgi:hypothetical protein
MSVEKHVFTIRGDCSCDYVVEDEVISNGKVVSWSQLEKINNELHENLVYQKNAITQHHRNKKWDKFKKLTNEYELIFTSTQGCPSIAKYSPISRSYFKLWEILYDFENEMNVPILPIKALFLADAPGGFCEALIKYRENRGLPFSNRKDKFYAMSLRATNKIIPDWKFNKEFSRKNNLTVLWGTDGSGDLYKLRVLDDLVDELLENECDFITADGGFDFSSDFNNQEDMSFRLILSEIYAATRLQKKGGNFILKIYDIHNRKTIKLLYILKLFYGEMFFVKPLSSRPANSEKYVVCTKFMMCDKKPNKIHTKIQQTMRGFIESLNMYNQNKNTTMPSFEDAFDWLEIPLSFMCDMVEYNRIYISFQMSHINDTLSMIDCKSQNGESLQKAALRIQLEKAVRWCHKYDMEVDLRSLESYKHLYTTLYT